MSLSTTLLSLLLSLIRSVAEKSFFGADGLWIDGCGFDYFDYYQRFLRRHSVQFFTYQGYPWYYPAPALFVHYPFYVLAHRTGNLEASYYVYVAFIGLAAIALTMRLGHGLAAVGLSRLPASLFSLSALLTSWPIYFAAQRGNIEGLTWLLVGAGTWTYARRRYRTASVFLGIAASVKIYPILFGALFLRRRRWRDLGFLAVAGILVTFLSLRFLEPPLGDALKRVFVGIRGWTVAYGEVYRDPEWDHSLFGLVKDLGHTSIQSYHQALITYYLLAGSAATTLLFARVRSLPTVNQVLYLSCAAVTLPPTSFDYTLCLLYVPFGWLSLLAVQAVAAGVRHKGLSVTMGLLGVVLAPTTFLYSAAAPALPGAFRTVCLVALLGVASAFPFDMVSRSSGEEIRSSELLTQG